MASLNDYKRNIQVLKMEQKIGRIQNELETVDYGVGCPLHGEDDCAEIRKAYDRGYVSGLYEALTLFKLIEADTPQTEDEYFLELMDAVKRGEMSDASANQAYYEYINKQAEESDTPQTEVPRQMRTFSEGGIGYTPQTEHTCATCRWDNDGKGGKCLFCCDKNDKWEPQTDCGWK